MVWAEVVFGVGDEGPGCIGYGVEWDWGRREGALCLIFYIKYMNIAVPAQVTFRP